jgi:hypothetical protein
MIGLKNNKQMLYLARPLIFIVTWQLEGFSGETPGANNIHIKVRHDIVID